MALWASKTKLSFKILPSKCRHTLVVASACIKCFEMAHVVLCTLTKKNWWCKTIYKKYHWDGDNCFVWYSVCLCPATNFHSNSDKLAAFMPVWKGQRGKDIDRTHLPYTGTHLFGKGFHTTAGTDSNQYLQLCGYYFKNLCFLTTTKLYWAILSFVPQKYSLRNLAVSESFLWLLGVEMPRPHCKNGSKDQITYIWVPWYKVPHPDILTIWSMLFTLLVVLMLCLVGEKRKPKQTLQTVTVKNKQK